MDEQETFYLSFGGNSEDSFERIKQALSLLAAHSDISELCHANFYSTSPVEVDSHRWFINTVCRLSSTLSLHKLFTFTQEIEVQLGKEPKPKTTSRPIDIDILFMGEQVFADDALEIPHPRWSERLFVLIPLADLTKEISLNVNGVVKYFDLNALIAPLLDKEHQVIAYHKIVSTGRHDEYDKN